MLAEEKGAKIRVVPINDRGELLIDEYEKLFNARTKLRRRRRTSRTRSARINPVKEMIAFAHERGVPVLVDGAQAAPHLDVDVQDLDCDFYAFSGHKMCGPTGIGILYGKAALLEKMQPFKGGGDMILSVTFEKTTYNTIPHKFEAGHAADRGGDRARRRGRLPDRRSACDAIAAHETELLDYATAAGESHAAACASSARPRRKAAVLSFAVEGVHPHDVGTLLNRGRRRDPHRPPLRAAGDAALQGAGDVRAPRSRSTTRWPKSTRWSPAIRNVQKVFA